MDDQLDLTASQACERRGQPGDEISLLPRSYVKTLPIRYGDRGDAFVVSTRARVPNKSFSSIKVDAGTSSDPIPSSQQTLIACGYFELAQSAWSAIKTKTCQHISINNRKARLPARCAAFVGFDGEGMLYGDGAPHVAILLTAGDAGMRWAAVEAQSHHNAEVMDGKRDLVVRQGCCLDCAITQRVEEARPCVLVT